MEKTRKNLDVCVSLWDWFDKLSPELHYKRMDFRMNKGEVAAYKQEMVSHDDEGRDISDSKSSKNTIVVILDTGH